MNKIKEFIKENPMIVVLQIAAMGIMIYYFNAYYLSKPQTNTTKADVPKDLTIALFPQDQQAVKDQTIAVTPILTALTDKKIGYIKLSIRFDNTHLRFVSPEDARLDANLELLIPPGSLEANQTGEIKLVYGAKSAENTPGNVIQLSQLKFDIIKEGQSSVDIMKDTSQVVYLDQSVSESNLQSAGINSLPSPSITSAIVVDSSTPSSTLAPTE